MGDYLKIVGGVPTDTNATATSAGAIDGGKVIKTNGAGKLDTTMLPEGVVPETRAIVASEALSAGSLVNVWSSGGAKVRKADAAAGKEAHGYVATAANAGEAVTVYTEEGVVAGLNGLTPGSRQFLSAATPGASTDVPPSASGQVAQVVGFALSATELLFRPRQPITLA